MMAESQCMWYLERDAAEPDLTKASQLLEDMLSSVGVESCIAVCENLLEKLSICENVLFIAEFMASSLEHDLSPVKKQHLVKVSIGCKVSRELSCLVCQWLIFQMDPIGCLSRHCYAYPRKHTQITVTWSPLLTYSWSNSSWIWR